MPLASFFSDTPAESAIPAQKVSDDELRFLTQMRRYSASLNDGDKKLLLAMVRKFASAAVPAPV